MNRPHRLLILICAASFGAHATGCAEDAAPAADTTPFADLHLDAPGAIDVAVDLEADAPRDPDSGLSPWGELNKLPGASFTAIWGSEPKDLYIVGQGGLIFHRNGLQWTREESGTAADLHGVYGISRSEVYAVGDRSLLSYDGAT